MSAFALMKTAMSALEYRRRNGLRRNEFQFESEVEVELLRGLRLDGFIVCVIQLDEDTGDILAIADQYLKIRDKDGEDCVVDWDDLKFDAQEKVELQVMKAYRETEVNA